MKKALEHYNTEDTLLVITSYPNPISGEYGQRDFNAIGEHSERRLPYLAKNRKVLVAAEDQGSIPTFSPSKNILIQRIWKKGNPLSFLKMFSFINSQTNVNSILVQFEFNVWGGIPSSLALILTLGLLRLSGKRVIFEMHQVTTDIGKLAKHVHITGPLKQFIFNTGLKFYYVMSGLVSTRVIVFEQELKDRLKAYVKESKIDVLSLSVDPQKVITKKKAIKEINKDIQKICPFHAEKIKALSSCICLKSDEYTLLVFGYINGYKGIDWITKALKDQADKKIRLVIAGGVNPYLMDKPYYQKFYKKVTSEIKKYAHMTHTGFIPDEKVSLYYSAADLVIMPYEVFMAASGPFSRALAHQKPLIVSDRLEDYAKTPDVKGALRTSGMTNEDLFFPLRKADLLKKIEEVRSKRSYKEKLVLFAKTLSEARSIESITNQYDELLFPREVRLPLVSQTAGLLVQS